MKYIFLFILSFTLTDLFGQGPERKVRKSRCFSFHLGWYHVRTCAYYNGRFKTNGINNNGTKKYSRPSAKKPSNPHRSFHEDDDFAVKDTVNQSGDTNLFVSTDTLSSFFSGLAKKGAVNILQMVAYLKMPVKYRETFQCIEERIDCVFVKKSISVKIKTTFEEKLKQEFINSKVANINALTGETEIKETVYQALEYSLTKTTEYHLTKEEEALIKSYVKKCLGDTIEEEIKVMAGGDTATSEEATSEEVEVSENDTNRFLPPAKTPLGKQILINVAIVVAVPVGVAIAIPCAAGYGLYKLGVVIVDAMSRKSIKKESFKIIIRVKKLKKAKRLQNGKNRSPEDCPQRF